MEYDSIRSDMTMIYDRVTVTMPRHILRETDIRARRLERSRSWVVAEALRAWLAVPAAERVADPVRAPYAVGLDEQRLHQLHTDMALTPEQRVHEAEETVELAFRVHRPPRRQQVLAFEHYADYQDWKAKDLLL